MRPVGLVVGRDLVGVAEVSVIHIAANNPVPTVQCEVECYDTYGSSHIIVFRAWCAKGVAERIAVITAQTDAQTLDGIVVDANGSSVVVGYFELVWAGGSVMNEVLGGETLGVQSGKELSLITPVLQTSPKGKSHLVPSVGHDGSLTLWTIDSEELVGFVIGVGVTYWHDNLSSLDVELAVPEFLVDPELLDVHFTAFLHFGLVFSGLLCFYLNCGTSPAMLKLYL